MKHIVIVRTSGSILNLSTYNCQELGLAKSLLKKGFRISLILAGEKYSEETIDGVNVIYCNFVSLNQQLSWFLNIESILNKLCPDVVQVHDMGVFMTWRVTLWAKKKKIPCFLIQGNYQETQKIFFRQLEMLFNKTFGTYVLHNVKGIGYKTLRASQYVKKYCARKTMATYIGLDVEKFVQADSIDWVGKLSLEGKKILLYVGSMEVRRNPLFLLDVVEGLSDEYILLLVGGGSLQDEIKTRIIESNLQSKCIYLGKLKQEELPSLYKISDLFLLASSYEIYGMVIMESMYFGLPVVSTLTAGSQTLIEDGKDGYIINDLDADEWRSCIRKICNDSSKYKMMSEFASNKIASEFLWDKASEKFLDLYFS